MDKNFANMWGKSFLTSQLNFWSDSIPLADKFGSTTRERHVKHKFNSAASSILEEVTKEDQILEEIF